ncbi:MAG: hypothetical protein AAGJ79_04120 [Verrucomicrobiota bacterium]
MKGIPQAILCLLLLAAASGCALRSQPRPLGRVQDEERHRTIVLDRTDEEVKQEERRAARRAKESRLLLPWTWF